MKNAKISVSVFNCNVNILAVFSTLLLSWLFLKQVTGNGGTGNEEQKVEGKLFTG